MDHYQEFDLSPAATADEIRQAHKKLARLLHPDQFQDPGMQALAARQMQRVNEISALLLDPRRRRMYDLTLNELPAPPAYLSSSRSRLRSLAGWAIAGVVSVSWMVAPRAAPPAARTVTAQPAVAPSQEKPPRPALPARSARRRPAESVIPSPAAPPAMPWKIEEPPALEIAAHESPEPAGPIEPPPQPMAREEQPKGLAGNWFYPRPALAPAVPELYPPEYIELVLREDSGRLRGRYQARYRVTDRAISPEVLFQMEGDAAAAGNASLRWADAGGARGEIDLKLVARDSLQVTWRATQLGRQLGLASGTAVLVRRREP